MTIIKQACRKRYSSISNILLQNNELSLRARGLMGYLLSLPDDWEMHVNHLVKVMKEGKHVILETLKELKDAGYIHHQKVSFKGGWKYFVFEEPVKPEEFKEFLRTNRFLNNSNPEQFEDQPLQKTKDSLSTKEELLHKGKTEEDFSSKKKEERKTQADSIAHKWIKDGRPKEVVERVLQAFKEQPLGSVRTIKRWMEEVYNQKFEEKDADQLFEYRRKFALKMEESNRNNYFFAKDKDVLCYTSAGVEKAYSIRGKRRDHEDFWRAHNLGKDQFLKFKETVDGSNRI